MKVFVLEDNEERIKWFRSHYPSAMVYTTAAEAIKWLTVSKSSVEWDLIFLDHDLGGTSYADSNSPLHGMEVVRWIEQNHPKAKRIIIHSLNYPAAIEMEKRLHEAGYPVYRMPFHRLVELSIGNDK